MRSTSARSIGATWVPGRYRGEDEANDGTKHTRASRLAGWSPRRPALPRRRPAVFLPDARAVPAAGRVGQGPVLWLGCETDGIRSRQSPGRHASFATFVLRSGPAAAGRRALRRAAPAALRGGGAAANAECGSE